MPIKQRIPRLAIGLLIVGLMMLIVVGCSSLYLLRRVDRYAETTLELQNARILTDDVLNDLQDAETGQRGFLLTDNPAYLAPFARASRHIETSIQNLSENPASRVAEIAALESQLARVADEKMSELHETSTLQTQQSHAQAMAIVLSDRGKLLMDQARHLVGQISTHIDQRRLYERGTLEERSNVLLAAAWIGLLSVLVCIAAMMVVIGRAIEMLRDAQKQTELANISLERRVRERTADLQEANQEVQRFAYIVSHDLRAPLVNVMGFTAELEAALVSIKSLLASAEQTIPAQVTEDARMAVNQDLPEALNFIRASTQRMDRLINAILKLSREGRRSLTPESLRVGTLFKSLVATMQHQLDDAGAQLQIKFPMPDVVSDRLALEQVFGNLIDNAVKYLDSDRQGSITISGETNPKGVRYQIEDNGRGIEERDRERVFELFRRAGKQNRPGDGIGLAHVRALVRRLGGTIDFTSVAGQGTRFFVQLPAMLTVVAARSAT